MSERIHRKLCPNECPCDYLETEQDNVNHPAHYTNGGIECIDAIKASLGQKEFADYCKGNIIKYVWRYRSKGGTEDLRKARVYLEWLIRVEEDINENKA